MSDLPGSHWLWLSVAMGVGATLAIDLWALLLQRAAALPSTDWRLVGRWFAGLWRGRFRLQTGPGATPVRGELALGWLVHYGVGIGYALAYLALLQAANAPVSPWSAAMFGLITVLAPWLILQPGLGKGFFAAATAKPNLARLLNLVTHLLFGAGLYLAWRIATAFNS